MSELKIDVQDLHKSYGDNEVLKGTLLDVTNDNEREGFQRIISRYDSKYKLNNGLEYSF